MIREITGKFIFSSCLFMRVLATSFVAVYPRHDFFAEILFTSFDQAQDSVSEILAEKSMPIGSQFNSVLYLVR